MTSLSNLAQLRRMLSGMERELGLTDLRPVERDVLYAMTELADGQSEQDGFVRSDALKAHPLCADIPPASYHRTLKTLIDRGLIRPAPNRKTGAYMRVTGL